VEHLGATRRAIDQVDHGVEFLRQPVYVLTIERRDEAAVEAHAHFMDHGVGRMLHLLDFHDVMLEALRFCKHRRQEPGGFLHFRSELVEKGEEPFVAWYERHEPELIKGILDVSLALTRSAFATNAEPAVTVPLQSLQTYGSGA
jgi:hypothetical protein